MRYTISGCRSAARRQRGRFPPMRRPKMRVTWCAVAVPRRRYDSWTCEVVVAGDGRQPRSNFDELTAAAGCRFSLTSRRAKTRKLFKPQIGPGDRSPRKKAATER